MWGAWIEIIYDEPYFVYQNRRSPCGERGLKFEEYDGEFDFTGRSPCGERGLKLCSVCNYLGQGLVAPRVGSVD